MMTGATIHRLPQRVPTPEGVAAAAGWIQPVETAGSYAFLIGALALEITVVLAGLGLLPTGH